MRVLLTGAAGFIGSHVAEALVARGEDVVGLDNFDGFYAPARKERNVTGLGGRAGWQLIRGDVRDAAGLDVLLSSVRFDAVVHLAARAGVRPSIDAPATYVDVNVGGTVAVVEAARRHGVRALVVASSSSVYGVDAEPPFRTDAPAIRQRSPYAASKRAAELFCTAFADLHGLAIVSLRYFTVYGPRQRPDMAISRFITAIESGEPVVMFGDGSARRDYTFVADAAAATLGALDHALKVAPGHRLFNVGDARTVRLDELISVIEKAVGRPANVVRQPEQPGDVPLTHADIEESRRELGYAPRVEIEEGVARQVAWQRLQGGSAAGSSP